MASVFHNLRLLAYLGGNLASITGTWGQRVVVFWMAWELTGSTSVIGLLAALDLMPSVLAAPLAGAMADSRPAFRLTRNVEAISALPPLLMAGVVLFGEASLPVLMLLTLVNGVLNGLDHPLRLWLVGRIAPGEAVPKAVAANSVVFNIGRMIGPAIGGWAVAAEAPELIFSYNAVSFLIFAAVIAQLGAGSREGPKAHSAAASPGWRAMFRSFEPPVALLFALFSAIAVLLRPIFELLPSFAEDLSQGRLDAAQMFSLLTSAQGLGAMLGAFAAAWLLPRLDYQASAVTAGLASAVAGLAFLLGTEFHVAIAALALLAGAVLANGIATQVAIQTRLPEAVRGRALSLYTMMFRGLPALGALTAGTLGEVVPLRLIFTILAVVTFGAALMVLRTIRRRARQAVHR